MTSEFFEGSDKKMLRLHFIKILDRFFRKFRYEFSHILPTTECHIHIHFLANLSDNVERMQTHTQTQKKKDEMNINRKDRRRSG